MPKTEVDPRIEIRTIADGEVHIVFSLEMDDLAQLARAFIAVSDGSMKAHDAKMVFRLRSKEGIDYLISRLQAAKKTLFEEKSND